MNNLTFCRGSALAIAALFALTSPVLANDDMLVYTERLNNGWQDWGWVPHYATNNPTFNGTNSMVFAANGALAGVVSGT